jgi:hypothetical protein
VEDHGDFILGPMSPKEYKDTVAELNGSRTNRVFEFFKVTAPERLGFAKHREAAERKVAALAAAGAGTGGAATSPCAGGTPSKKTTKKTAPATAATVAAEGKAQKKRGTRPMDSPPTTKKTRFVDLDTSVAGSVIAVAPMRVAAPPGGAGGETSGPLLVPLSPKEKDSDEDSGVQVVSSVGDTSRDRSPLPLGHEAPCKEGRSSTASSGSSSSSSENTGQSASPSAMGAEKDDFVAEAEEEEEPESSNYRVTLEEPQAAAARLQITSKAKLIGGKQIRFLGLMSGGHERKFLDEASSSFAIPHEEEYFSGFNSEDLVTACGDLALKGFVASWCLAQKLEREEKEAKDSSAATVASLQTRVEAGGSNKRRRMALKHRRLPSNRFAPMWRG